MGRLTVYAFPIVSASVAWPLLASKRAREARKRRELKRFLDYPPALRATDAELRAFSMLHRHLSDHQRETLKKFLGVPILTNQREYFVPIAGFISYRFRDEPVVRRNLPEMWPWQALCVHIIDSVPWPDQMLAMMMAIDANEDGFMQTANRLGSIMDPYSARARAIYSPLDESAQRDIERRVTRIVHEMHGGRRLLR